MSQQQIAEERRARAIARALNMLMCLIATVLISLDHGWKTGVGLLLLAMYVHGSKR